MANPRYEPRYNNQINIDYDNPARAGAKRMSNFSSVPADPENTSWQDSVSGYDASFVESPQLTFNGIDNYLDLGNPAYLNFIPNTDSFQIEFNIDNYSGTASKLVYVKRSVGDTLIFVLVWFNANSDFVVFAGGTETTYAGAGVADGNLHNVKIVIPSSSGILVYFDNVSQTITAGTGLVGTNNNTGSDVRIGAEYNDGKYLVASISNLKFTKNNVLVAQFPMSEGAYDDTSDVINDLQVTMAGTTSNIWDNTQDSFHWNVAKGFDKWTLDADGSILEVPYQSDGTPTLTDGDAIAGHTWVSTHPYIPQGHNGCSTKFLMPAGNAKLIAADYDNLWYDGSEDPIANTFQNIPTRIGQNDLTGRYGGMLMDTNGDGLADGVVISNVDTLSLVNNSQTFTAIAQYGSIATPQQEIPANAVIYARIDIKSSVVSPWVLLVMLGKGQKDVRYGGSGDFESLSIIDTNNSTARNIYIVAGDLASSDWQPISVKNAVTLNLTAIFGAGHEPSQAFMDAHYLEYLGIDTISKKDQTAKTAKGMTVYHRKQDQYDSKIIQRRKGITE